VTTPDYEGPKAASSAGIQAGKAALDSTRATLNSTNITTISLQARAIMWDYSGGNAPSQFAAQLQPYYSTDLNNTIIGTVRGALLQILQRQS